MSNGGASLDASTLSYDHAVAVEPLLVEQIEVVRGPAALQYGGSAIGGAVNVIDNRIPKAPVKGVHGRAEVRAGGAESEKAAAGLVTVHLQSMLMVPAEKQITSRCLSRRVVEIL
jgi:iron complex outermembrane receptor protein